MRSSAAMDHRRQSSPSILHDFNQQPANNNGQHRRRSPVGGRADVPASRRPEYGGSRSDILSGARAEVSGSRGDIPADGRPGHRMDSPHRHRAPEPTPRHRGQQHGSPVRHITDQFSRQARHESPGRAAPRSDAVQPMRRDDPAKVIMPSSSDIILRPAVPISSEQKFPPSSCESLVTLTGEDVGFVCVHLTL